MTNPRFPVDTSSYKPLSLDLGAPALTPGQYEQWLVNIGVMRDVIVFFTAVAGARGMGGHTGGAFDVVPEALLLDGYIRGGAPIHPVLYDEAGHRVALQYALSAFNGHIPFADLLQYRVEGHGLYGHPEVDPERGIFFASGRLGHIWPFINGVALAHPDETVVLLGSDGSAMEGDNAEAARLAVGQQLNVKLFIDDNNITIAGHPEDYMPGFDVAATLAGQGLAVDSGQGEDFEALAQRVHAALNRSGPVALVNLRKMAPGVEGIEDTPAGHDVIPVQPALAYLRKRGLTEAAEFLEGVPKHSSSRTYLGSSEEEGSNRKAFGSVVADLIDEIPAAERRERVMVIDSDLAGSTGLNTIEKRHPEVFVAGGVMERGNFSAAAGFGSQPGRVGVFSTFSAFLEMIVSEVTMARLNHANVLCHFSHAGVDAIADNTSHFGTNIFFADNGLEEQGPTPLYFPADTLQFEAVTRKIFFDDGVRFLFSTRSEVPYILDENGGHFFDPANGYSFDPAKDEIIRPGTAGWVVSYGDMLYRALDAVEQLRARGIDVGLINKPVLNVIDEETLQLAGSSPFVLLVENQNSHTGLGSRYGTWLLERNLKPRYERMGVTKLGEGGTWAQLLHQGLGADDILRRLEKLANQE
jgi:transketolase C-terminal domain/subunit/transketolase N-terminal domain/subunit